MTRLTRIRLLAVAAAATAATLVHAQTSPATPGSRPTVTSPYWGDQTNRNGAYAPGGITTYDETTKLVAQTIQAVPQAHADYVVSQWTYTKLNNDLNVSTNHLRDDFRSSDEYANATNEFNAAYGEFAAARQDAIKGIQSSDDYRAAMDLRKSVSDQISNVAGADPKKADTDRLTALAELKLEYVTPVRTVERELIAASPRVASARERLVKAAREVARLEKTFARDVRDSIELADIRKNVASARIAYLASWTYLQEARYARDLSFAYAANGRNADGFRGNYDEAGYGGYGGCGYGYGGFGYGTAVGVGYNAGVYTGTGGGNGIAGGNGVGGAPNRGVGSNGFSPGFVNGGNGYSGATPN